MGAVESFSKFETRWDVEKKNQKYDIGIFKKISHRFADWFGCSYRLGTTGNLRFMFLAPFKHPICKQCVSKQSKGSSLNHVIKKLKFLKPLPPLIISIS